MSEPRAQSFESHAQIRAEFHYFVFLVLLVNFFWSAYQLYRGFSGGAIVGLLVSIALIVMALSLRVQVLTVQDRVIRLEMRHRFKDLLPADVAARAAGLSVKQLVALRFASDTELPALVQDVVGGQLSAPRDIKQRIQQWQADHLRA